MNIENTETGITIETPAYNERRYGKPWCAVVTFLSPSKLEYNFGDWCGSPGEAGALYLECYPTDVIATGQKDFRKPKNSAPDFWIFDVNKEEWVKNTRHEVYEYHRSMKASIFGEDHE